MEIVIYINVQDSLEINNLEDSLKVLLYVGDSLYMRMGDSLDYINTMNKQRKDIESLLQRELISMCRLCAEGLLEGYPETPSLLKLFHIPNGGLRSKSVAIKLKAEGVRSGIPDLFYPEARGGFFGLWIEMKKPDGTTSISQEEVIPELRRDGYRVVVCDNVKDAWGILWEYSHLPSTRISS